MTGEKRTFGFGLVVGVIVAALFFYYFAPRYTTVTAGDAVVKQDRWTGKSWRFADRQWKPITSTVHDWEKINEALREALRVPARQENTADLLSRLKGRFPALKPLSDEELLEAIKVFYSREVLSNLYLQQFEETEAADAGGRRETGSNPVN